MSPETNLLQDLLKKARSRRQLLLSLRGVAISLAVIALLLVLLGWAAHRYRYNAAALTTLRVGALLTCLADRKSTRLNSSHGYISYAVFCLKKKNRGATTARP